MMKLESLQLPPYSLGACGAWNLTKRPSDPRWERGYVSPPALDDYLVLSRDGQTWMTTSRLEQESHLPHLPPARGHVLVCGIGMGMYLYNLTLSAQVTSITAVDFDPDVVELLRKCADLDRWGQGIKFIFHDALRLDEVKIDPVDFLYVDIWAHLASAEALNDVKLIQHYVGAKCVGWWGQEWDFAAWMEARRGGQRRGEIPTLAEWRRFGKDCGLPLVMGTDAYMSFVQMATRLAVLHTSGVETADC